MANPLKWTGLLPLAWGIKGKDGRKERKRWGKKGKEKKEGAHSITIALSRPPLWPALCIHEESERKKGGKERGKKKKFLNYPDCKLRYGRLFRVGWVDSGGPRKERKGRKEKRIMRRSPSPAARPSIAPASRVLAGDDR